MLTQEINIYHLQNGVRVVISLENSTQVSLILYHKMTVGDLIAKLAEVITILVNEWSSNANV